MIAVSAVETSAQAQPTSRPQPNSLKNLNLSEWAVKAYVINKYQMF